MSYLERQDNLIFNLSWKESFGSGMFGERALSITQIRPALWVK